MKVSDLTQLNEIDLQISDLHQQLVSLYQTRLYIAAPSAKSVTSVNSSSKPESDNWCLEEYYRLKKFWQNMMLPSLLYVCCADA